MYSEHLNGTLTAVLYILITVVTTVIITITCPHARDALAIAAKKFVGFACKVLGHTHAVLIHQLQIVTTSTFSL
jgi:uncharacterized membrane protein YccF (DUF307 family)